MGQITLNKPSGGQLTLSPEDGTSNETVTIPSVGIGKVLGGAMYQHTGSNVDFSTTNATATPLTITYTPKSATSHLIVKYGMQINIYHATFDGQGGETYIFRDGVNTISSSFGYKKADCFVYINHGNPKSDHYHKMAGEQWIPSNSTNPTTFTVYASNYTGQSALRMHAHDGVSFISVMEVAS